MRAPRLTRLRLDRIGAWGPFPAYRVEVDEDGFVEWEGQRSVLEMGRRTWRVPRADVLLIERQLDKARFLFMAEHYESAATDVGAVSISARFSDGSEQCVCAGDMSFSAPRAFFQLAERIELVLGTASRIGAEPRPRSDGRGAPCRLR